MTIIIAVIAISGIVATTIIIIMKLRRRPAYRVFQRSASNSSSRILKVKSALSISDSLDLEHEYQRQYMIRKSLASRAALHETHAEVETQNEDNQRETDKTLDDEVQIADKADKKSNLIQDWKEFEAQIRRDHSRSLRRHPSLTRLSRLPPSTRRASEPLMACSRPLSMTEEVADEEERVNNGKWEAQAEWENGDNGVVSQQESEDLSGAEEVETSTPNGVGTDDGCESDEDVAAENEKVSVEHRST